MDMHDVVLLTISQQPVETKMKREPIPSRDLIHFFVFRLATLRSLRTRVFF